MQSSLAVTQAVWCWQLLNVGSSVMTLVQLLGVACIYAKSRLEENTREAPDLPPI